MREIHRRFGCQRNHLGHPILSISPPHAFGSARAVGKVSDKGQRAQAGSGRRSWSVYLRHEVIISEVPDSSYLRRDLSDRTQSNSSMAAATLCIHWCDSMSCIDEEYVLGGRGALHGLGGKADAVAAVVCTTVAAVTVARPP